LLEKLVVPSTSEVAIRAFVQYETKLLELAVPSLDLKDQPFSGIPVILQQPLWKHYFRLCVRWNVPIQSTPSSPKLGQWTSIRQKTSTVATALLTFTEAFRLHNITLGEFSMISDRKDNYLSFMELLHQDQLEQLFVACGNAIRSFEEQFMLVSSLMTVWVPKLPREVDLRQLQQEMIFYEQQGKSALVSSLNTVRDLHL
jgi:hypothetical protein